MQKINLPTPPQINHSFKEIGSYFGGGMKTGMFVTGLTLFGAGYSLSEFYNKFFRQNKRKKIVRIPFALALTSVALLAIIPFLL